MFQIQIEDIIMRKSIVDTRVHKDVMRQDVWKSTKGTTQSRYEIDAQKPTATSTERIDPSKTESGHALHPVPLRFVPMAL